MSNEQWPDGQSPWAKPDPRWQPQSYHEAQGRDPHKPFGAQAEEATQAPSLEHFQEPSRRMNPFVLIFGALAIVVAVLLGLRLIGGPDVGPAETEPPRPRPTQIITPGTAGTSIPFEGNGNGTFEILDQSWNGNEVEVKVRISVTSGEHGFTLYMFDNETRQVMEPISGGSARASQDTPYEGTVSFRAPKRGPCTLVLSNEYNRAITALPVKG